MEAQKDNLRNFSDYMMTVLEIFLSYMLQVAFVPHPNGIDDTSYFVSRHSLSSIGTFDDQDCSDAASDTFEFFSDTKEMDECGDLAEFKAYACDVCPGLISLSRLISLI
ncbi:hypothetical protein L1987_57690 [Smallanthus sonchifolius]|uniref:Uncharacterized protein n=1 Tax=Smallanthus sonchifolius TaxID=185202 RepID=A0ACB9DD99_9ASTR|nr:hypothetical protein L1987_57690 [Smallanthus sonchifolius]